MPGRQLSKIGNSGGDLDRPMPRDRFDTSETSGGIGVSSNREGFSYEIRAQNRLLREAGGGYGD